MKYQLYTRCLLCAISLNSIFMANAQVNKIDSLALAGLYKSTNGQNWSDNANWLTSKPVSSWFGITVTGKRVTRIKLDYNNLTDSLPASIGNLKALRVLNLFGNYHLESNIPAAIGNLVQLDTLDLGYCHLKGSIPSSIGGLKVLKYLDLYKNRLRGNIPASIGNLINLTQCDFDENNLTGAIPSSIGDLKKIEYITMEKNNLSGTLPESIGNLENLIRLTLTENNIEGPIPATIGNLKNLQGLYLAYNKLTGSIPASIGNLVNLRFLHLYTNKLTGTLPASIGKLKNAVSIYLFQNQLTGEIPASFFKLDDFVSINLSDNRLTQKDNFNIDVPVQPNATIIVSDNQFSFNGLEFLVQKRPGSYYNPQAIIHVRKHGNTLAVSAGGTLSNNTYTWFKVGKTGSTTITGDSVFTPAQNGKYYVKVTNAIATALTLASDTITNTMNATLVNSNLMAGENKNNQVNVTVSPNPAGDFININSRGVADIVLINSEGKIICSKTITGNAVINVNALTNGIYYIKNMRNGKAQKIVIAH